LPWVQACRLQAQSTTPPQDALRQIDMQDARFGPKIFRIPKNLTRFERLLACHAPIKACYDRDANPGFHHSIAIDFL
jgi:hypothetical protein